MGLLDDYRIYTLKDNLKTFLSKYEGYEILDEHKPLPAEIFNLLNFFGLTICNNKSSIGKLLIAADTSPSSTQLNWYNTINSYNKNSNDILYASDMLNIKNELIINSDVYNLYGGDDAIQTGNFIIPDQLQNGVYYNVLQLFKALPLNDDSGTYNYTLANRGKSNISYVSINDFIYPFIYNNLEVSVTATVGTTIYGYGKYVNVYVYGVLYDLSTELLISGSASSSEYPVLSLTKTIVVDNSDNKYLGIICKASTSSLEFTSASVSYTVKTNNTYRIINDDYTITTEYL